MKSSRFEISVLEIFAGVAILSGLFAFVMPAVNRARDLEGKATYFGEFAPFAVENGWSRAQQVLFIPCFAVVMAFGASLLLLAIRSLLPATWRQRIVWFPEKYRAKTITRHEPGGPDAPASG